jgi:hypothetical protein
MFNSVVATIHPEARRATFNSSDSVVFHQPLQGLKALFTFDVLNTFHLLTLQGKVSAYEFYCALQHKTDNTSISDTKVRFYSPWTSD